MTTFTFLFLDGIKIILKAAGNVRHLSGHVAIEKVKILDGGGLLQDGAEYSRLNIGLYGLRVMFPEKEPEEFIANCTGWCAKHPDTLTVSGVCQKCKEDEILNFNE